MSNRRMVKVLGGLALAGLLSAPGMVMAQDAAPATEPPPINAGKIGLTFGVDWYSQYYFRGVNQVNNGIILQPYADIAFKLWEGDGPINSLTADIGIWNNFTDAHRVSSGSDHPNTWEEADLYGSLTVGFLDNFSFTTTYIVYKYPDVAPGGEQQELMFKLAFNDSDALGPFAVHPYVMYALQIDNNVDGNGNENQYAEVGIAPSVTVLESSDYPITITVPIVAGFSLDGTYVDDGTGQNQFWGYASVSVLASVPLTFIPADYGTWTFTAGPTWLILNSQVSDTVNFGGNDNVVYAKAGVSMSY